MGAGGGVQRGSQTVPHYESQQLNFFLVAHYVMGCSAADGKLNTHRNLKHFISLTDSAHRFQESIRAGASSRPMC